MKNKFQYLILFIIFDSMRKKFLKYFVFFYCILLLSFKGFTQDIHYTQYSFLPLLQNPASVGFFDANMRFSTIYRNQWATVPVNYNSIGFSYDLNFLEHFKTGSKAGAGLNFYFDQAGDSKFQTMHLMIPLAYHFYLPINDNKLKISLGAEGGFQYKALSTADLYYDSQFNGEVFDKDAQTNENFSSLNVFNLDVGAGLNFEFETESEIKIGLGFAIKHLNNAEEYYLNNNIKPILRKRFVIPAKLFMPLGDKWDIDFSYLFNFQNKSQEHLIGLLFGYYLENISVYKKKINFGVFYRVQDATSIVLQYETNNFKTGLSYDVNLSKFTKATNSYGGVELGFTYLLHNVLKTNLKLNKKCFTF